MNETCISQFLTVPTVDRFKMALDPKYMVDISHYLGQAGYKQYVNLAQKTLESLSSNHISINAQPNLIFVPGVMGSSLQSETYGGTWWLDLRVLHHIDDIKLSDDGQNDANPNFKLTPGTTDLSYEAFLGAILMREDFGHVIFPYDWRKALKLSTQNLKNKILSIYENNGHQDIHLVAHSMGGLLVRATLMEYGEFLWPKVGRIVFLGTPHYGSPAIAGYLKNHLWGFDKMALLGKYLSRETFRSLSGVISLLPAPRGIYPGTRANDPQPWLSGDQGESYEHPCVNFDLYDVDSWKLELTGEQKDQLRHLLLETQVFYNQLNDAHNDLSGDYCDRMAIIAGVGYKTLFRLAFEKGFAGMWEKTRKITSRIENDAHREGDGSVPLASVQLEYVGAIHYVNAKHGALPNIPDVYDDVFRWLNGERMKLPDTQSGALSNHLAGCNEISDTPSLDGSEEEIDRWQSEESYIEKLPALEEKLMRNQLPEFMTVRLL